MDIAERDAAIKSVHAMLWKMVRRHTGRYGGDADDAYQECIALICMKWPQFNNDRGRFTTWVMKIIPRHLKQCYILGRFNGPVVRPSYRDYCRGVRVGVASIYGHDGIQVVDVPNREPKPELSEAGFISFAEGLVGRKLKRAEQKVLLWKFFAVKGSNDVSNRMSGRHAYSVRETLRRFMVEARFNRAKQGLRMSDVKSESDVTDSDLKEHHKQALDYAAYLLLMCNRIPYSESLIKHMSRAAAIAMARAILATEENGGEHVAV